MGKFDGIKTLLKQFKADTDSLANNKMKEVAKAKDRLNERALKEELASLDAEYDKHFKATCKMYSERINDAISDRRISNADKYLPGHIDLVLLDKLNIISQSGVQLEESEITAFCKEAMKSRSMFCVRKVEKMAVDNNFKLNVPNEEKANETLDAAQKQINKVLYEYRGALTGTENGRNGSDGNSMMINVLASGTFLNRLEKEYEGKCIEDIQISRISQKNFAKLNAEEQKKKEQEPVEVVNTDHVNISAKSDDSRSPAAQYVKGLSQKMAACNE